MAQININDESIDGALGTQTQGGRIEGKDESTELWRHKLKYYLWVGKHGRENCDRLRSRGSKKAYDDDLLRLEAAWLILQCFVSNGKWKRLVFCWLDLQKKRYSLFLFIFFSFRNKNVKMQKVT